EGPWAPLGYLPRTVYLSYDLAQSDQRHALSIAIKKHCVNQHTVTHHRPTNDQSHKYQCPTSIRVMCAQCEISTPGSHRRDMRSAISRCSTSETILFGETE